MQEPAIAEAPPYATVGTAGTAFRDDSLLIKRGIGCAGQRRGILPYHARLIYVIGVRARRTAADGIGVDRVGHDLPVDNGSERKGKDVSALCGWHRIEEYGVLNKLLFGSDYPFTTPDATMDALRNFNRMVEGTNLPRLETSEIDALIHSPALEYLGLQ